MPVPPAVDPSYLDRLRINFSWILKLRWAAAAGQLATIVLVWLGLGIELPLMELFAVLAFEAISNAVLAGWWRGAVQSAAPELRAERVEAVLGSIVVVDIVLLTVLLFLTGGPTNPFSVFYMVNIVLAAMVLSTSWAAVVGALALAGYCALFFVHLPLPDLDAMNYVPAGGGSESLFGGRLSLYLKGLIAAFTTAAAVIAVFVSRLTSQRAALEAALSDVRQRQARSERFEALGTLAAGAAHELASPLSTIAVVAKDLERELLDSLKEGDAVEDARLIRREVMRCRAILDQMALDAGQSTGEGMAPTSVAELVEAALAPMKHRERVDVALADDCRGLALVVPKNALSLALRQLIKNAVDASSADARVELHLGCAGDRLRVEVVDRGTGMTEDVVARATDPFFTTKEPGKGMGLGLFLARTVIERLDGRLALDSAPGRGTTARVHLPLARLLAEPRSEHRPSREKT